MWQCLYGCGFARGFGHICLRLDPPLLHGHSIFVSSTHKDPRNSIHRSSRRNRSAHRSSCNAASSSMSIVSIRGTSSTVSPRLERDRLNVNLMNGIPSVNNAIAKAAA